MDDIKNKKRISKSGLELLKYLENLNPEEKKELNDNIINLWKKSLNLSEVNKNDNP